ncbi:hypothetical protein V5F29_05215 [Xanthobacter aminoxidans]|uniref:hypothetical protein n=1 Tax=Xanthobacter aminoxidans TaxID=186280 RepID=UPI0037299A13
MHLQTPPPGPRHGLFAARSLETLERLASYRHRDFLPVINRAALARARQFAHGRADWVFMERNLPCLPTAVRLR